MACCSGLCVLFWFFLSHRSVVELPIFEVQISFSNSVKEMPKVLCSKQKKVFRISSLFGPLRFDSKGTDFLLTFTLIQGLIWGLQCSSAEIMLSSIPYAFVLCYKAFQNPYFSALHENF
jgi:hypothetical protein